MPAPSRPIELTRESLYARVWAEPMVRLARRYRISDVGLAKICRKMDIPVPPPGYWQRKETGWNPAHPPLPALRPGISGAVSLTPRLAPAEPSPEVTAQEAFEREPKNRVRVPRQLSSPHPLVAQTATVLREARVGLYGTLSTRRGRCLAVHVSPGHLGRALRILDALFKALAARGFRVGLSEGDRPDTHVTIFGHPVRITLEEKMGRVDHVPTKADGSFPPRWDYVPSGRFTFRIDEWRASGVRKSWSEGKRGPLEGQLNDIIRGLVVVADAKRTCLLAEEREAQARLEAQRQRELDDERRREEEERRRQLEREADSWAQAQQLRAFIDEVERRASIKGVALAPGSDLGEWVTWARRHADRLDPLKPDPDAVKAEDASAGPTHEAPDEPPAVDGTVTPPGHES